MADPQSSTIGSTGAATRGSILHEVEDESVPIWGWLFNSDSTPASPWARKIILSLDGGGVRGYASLLILDSLMERVRTIEEEISENRRQERQRLQGTVVERDKLCEHSAAYRWSKPPHSPNGQLPQHHGGFKPHQYIDYFVGTSTGGLSVMMLGRLQMTVSEAMAQYDVVGADVFGRPRAMTWKGVLAPRYKSRHMDLALQRITHQFGYEAGRHTGDMIVRAGTTFGANGNNGNGKATNRQRDHAATRHQADRVTLRNGNVDTARTVVVAHGTWDDNLQTKRPLLFRSYDHPPPNITSADSGPVKHHKPFAASDLPLWKIGRATSAAPTYFSPMVIGEHKIKDGAIGEANNPILLAYEEVKQVHWKNEPCLIISIGTGIQPQKEMQQGRALLPVLENLRETRETSKWFQKLALDSESKHLDFKRELDG
ncbi:unnamed protein product [Lecanosticta acicola]|uniref:Unnamed protein product n=1 Tax=Lecanosticta acicola TaxID=111012 RepID=A0AAI8YTB5_9PEZI|nr:unnamed protein product [Lecanosticta acicola]